MIHIVDYGMGNLRSVEKAFHKLGYPATVTNASAVIRSADAVVLPGVGAFGRAMEALQAKNLDTALRWHIERGKPFLGICLGLQLLFSQSEEFGNQQGLGIFPGKVVRFRGTRFERVDPRIPAELRIPHMGWNEVRKVKEPPLLAQTPDKSMFYFVHSYYPVPDDPSLVATLTDHGGYFCSSVWKDNVFACQFHPEKSGPAGLAVLEQFATPLYGPRRAVEKEEPWFQPRPQPPRPQPGW